MTVSSRAAILIVVTFLIAAGHSPVVPAQAPSPDRWEEVIQAFEVADREAPPFGGAVLFVGSSSIRLWTTLTQDFPSLAALNRGFGGSGMGDLVHYADRIVIPYAPSHVVVYTGENDLARGATAEDVFAAYRKLVAAVRARLPDTAITFVSMKPSPSRRDLMDEMQRANAMVADFSSHDDRLGYIDVFTSMLDGSGEPRAELFVDDMLHLNGEGYALWTSIIAPYLER